jgi:2-C-methyl-D-erythritol 4-phosphate cytidylyltransferase
MSDAPRCFALVPCAGVGQRSGTDGPKQYRPVAGQAVVAHTLDALLAVPAISATLVVLSPADNQFEQHAPRFTGMQAWVSRCGGITRAASVRAGLDVLLQRGVGDQDWVLVHDAARCLVQAQWVERLIAACLEDAVGGLLALPLPDTLKSSKQERVTATLPRSDMWLAQTPQMFRLGLLQRALKQAGDAVTDESSAVEMLGLQPRLVPGALENFKLTWPADFALAARLLETR